MSIRRKPALSAPVFPPSASVCEVCGTGILKKSTPEYGRWITIGYTPCAHKETDHKDTIKEITVTIYHNCNRPRCGIGFIYSQGTERKIIH